MKFRICKICGFEKPVDSFYIRKTIKSNKIYTYHRKECKNCIIIRSNKNYRENFQKRQISERDWTQRVFMPKMRLKTYGLSPSDYNLMLNKYNGGCYICKEKNKIINVDHCHETGKIRGLLFQACNLGLGNFRDQVCHLESAIKYLKEYSSQSVNKMAQQGG